MIRKYFNLLIPPCILAVQELEGPGCDTLQHGSSCKTKEVQKVKEETMDLNNLFNIQIDKEKFYK